MAFTSAQTMMSAVLMFFLSVLTSLILILAGGTVLDVFHNTMVDAGIFDVPDEWYNYTTYNYLVLIYYGMCALIPFLGGFFLAMTIYHQYILDDDEDDQPPVYTGGQF